ncbi:Lrp/AsnC family transcriptional regulator [Aeromonas media]|uniref:Lrp/AsnC family transcriptional regulator n=1 Tax=Aeromonas media TaxID=651 RepID=UPI003CFD64F6
MAPATMGWPITMLVLVTLERDHGRIVDEMIGVLKGEPEVMDLWYVTGEQDFVLQVAARDMASYEQFTRRVLHAREQVRSFKTLVVMGQHKRCGALLPG